MCQLLTSKPSHRLGTVHFYTIILLKKESSQMKEKTSVSLASIWNQCLALTVHLKFYLNYFLIKDFFGP